MLTVAEALEQIVSAVEPAAPERVPLDRALGTVLAEEILSDSDSPPFDKSMMDGYAIRAADCLSPEVELPVVGELSAGQTTSEVLAAGTVLRIMTGAPLPPGADAVVPIEQTAAGSAPERVVLRPSRPVRPGDFLVSRGASMQRGERLLLPGCLLRPPEIAILAELGQAHPLVRTAPTLAVLATGDELVAVDQTPGPGQIRNSNAIMLAAQAEMLGARVLSRDVARDHVEDLRNRILRGLDCDILCLSGGVSMGTRDFVPQVLRELGVRAEFHRLAMKPGKPLLFGTLDPGPGQGRRRLVFGLPGNPVSSMVCFELFVRTAIRRFLGIEPAVVPPCQAELQRDLQQQNNRPTWFPAVMTTASGRLLVSPLRWQGSFDLRGTLGANCSLCLPAGEVHWRSGDLVPVLPWGSISGMEEQGIAGHQEGP